MLLPTVRSQQLPNCRYHCHDRLSRCPLFSRAFIANVTDHEDVWCILFFDDVVTDGYERPTRSLWVMVTAKPHDSSVQRILLDPHAHKDTIICERIGDLKNLNTQWGGAVKKKTLGTGSIAGALRKRRLF